MLLYLQLESRNVLSLHLRGRLLTNSSYGAAVLLRGVTRFNSLVTGRSPNITNFAHNILPSSLSRSRYCQFAVNVTSYLSRPFG